MGNSNKIKTRTLNVEKFKVLAESMEKDELISQLASALRCMETGRVIQEYQEKIIESQSIAIDQLKIVNQRDSDNLHESLNSEN